MRRVSIILAIASIIIPAALLYLSTLEAQAEVQARGGPICGLAFFADFILASVVCVLLSAVGFISLTHDPSDSFAIATIPSASQIPNQLAFR